MDAIRFSETNKKADYGKDGPTLPPKSKGRRPTSGRGKSDFSE